MKNKNISSSKRSDSDKKEITKDITRTTTALSASETVNRFGSANAEFIKGYTGTDKETGQIFSKGLEKIFTHKINDNPEKAAANIKQQAGFSAEVATTSRDNAEAIINRSEIRTSRSDDLPQYGKNHNIVDRVQILDGNIIEGTQTQMKFVGDRNELFKNIAEDNQKGNSKFARYRGTKIELPSEQIPGAADYCTNKAKALREQAEAVAAKGGPPDVVERLRNNAENYDQLATNIKDSGLTTEQAIFYRQHPKIATALDIARTSHRAGVEGATYGAAIGGSISLLQNIFALAQNEKNLSEATTDLTIDISKAGLVGYGTASIGSAIKSGMQQSGNTALRTLSKTNAPALVVNICLSLGSSVKRYIAGDITESQFLTEVGEKGAGMLSSGMMAALGQLAIPIPFVGAAIGGMIGYTLSSLFYQSALDSARAVEASRAMLARTRAIQVAARDRMAQEQASLDAFIRQEIPQLLQETQEFFSLIQDTSNSTDQLAAGINRYASLLGKKLQFENLQDFDDFMINSTELLKL